MPDTVTIIIALTGAVLWAGIAWQLRRTNHPASPVTDRFETGLTPTDCLEILEELESINKPLEVLLRSLIGPLLGEGGIDNSERGTVHKEKLEELSKSITDGSIHALDRLCLTGIMLATAIKENETIIKAGMEKYYANQNARQVSR